MDEKIMVNSELKMKNWFIENYKKLGYSKIIRKDIGVFPDFIMLKNNKECNVELETLLSNFLLHKHSLNEVDDIICIKKDINLNANIIELDMLDYKPRTIRISATIEEKTDKILDEIIKNRRFRNKSHAIEIAIEKLWEKQKDEQ